MMMDARWCSCDGVAEVRHEGDRTLVTCRASALPWSAELVQMHLHNGGRSVFPYPDHRAHEGVTEIGWEVWHATGLPRGQ